MTVPAARGATTEGRAWRGGRGQLLRFRVDFFAPDFFFAASLECHAQRAAPARSSSSIL